MTSKKKRRTAASELAVRDDLGEGKPFIFDPIQEVAFLV
jgi:hypothetical protein